jgi:hypothetical protein
MPTPTYLYQKHQIKYITLLETSTQPATITTAPETFRRLATQTHTPKLINFHKIDNPYPSFQIPILQSTTSLGFTMSLPINWTRLARTTRRTKFLAKTLNTVTRGFLHLLDRQVLRRSLAACRVVA